VYEKLDGKSVRNWSSPFGVIDGFVAGTAALTLYLWKGCTGSLLSKQKNQTLTHQEK
jgi:hypothetical protein